MCVEKRGERGLRGGKRAGATFKLASGLDSIILHPFIQSTIVIVTKKAPERTKKRLTRGVPFAFGRRLAAEAPDDEMAISSPLVLDRVDRLL